MAPMMTEPWRVIITRPQAQAQIWAEQLQAQGFHTQLLNLLDIRPLMEPEQQRAIQNRIMDFDLYQKAIFVSQNAVDQGMEWLDRYWPQLPMGVKFFAVGATTARILAAYGVVVEDLAQAESGSMTSESLLQASGLQDVAGEKIIIFRGLGGRGHLGEALQARGAHVDYCELYERCLPIEAGLQLQTLLMDKVSWAAHRNLFALHSGESLEHLLTVLAQVDMQQPSTQLRPMLQDAWLLVPSERIKLLADAAGFKHILVASNATDAAMTQALLAANSDIE
jgi:uroporphyrinogen-III synthase